MLTQLNRQKTCCSILKKSSASRSDHELTLLSAVMREVPQFQQLDAPSLKALGQQMQIRRFAKGEVIVQEGDYGNEFYVLLTGAVNIYTTVAEMDPKTKVAPRLVDYTVVAQAEAPEKSPSAPKAKSRTLRALNRRISYTVDWDAMEKKAKPGGGEELEGTSSSTLGRRGSIQGQGKRRGSTFSDSESEEEDMEDLRPRGGLGHSSSSLARAMMRRDSCEEKSPRKQQGPQLRTALLFPGSSFGELGLNPTPIARQSTAKCEEKCAVAILRREDYDEILTKTQSSRRAEWLAFACQAPILRNFDLLKHLHLEAHMKIQQVSKGEKVVKIGDPLQVLFLAEGVFAVSMPAQGAETSKPEVEGSVQLRHPVAAVTAPPQVLAKTRSPCGIMASLWGTITGWEQHGHHPSRVPTSTSQGAVSLLSLKHVGRWAFGAGSVAAISMLAARSRQRRRSCCPANALGPLVARGATRGTLETLPGGLNAYVVGKGNGRAVVVASDIFGIHTGRHKEICDSIAEEGFLVILPDFFRGSPRQSSGGFFDALQQAASLWTPLNTSWSSVENDLAQAVLPYLEEQGCSVERCALLGFCWGAWLVCHACGSFNFCCGAMAHPSVHNLVLRWGEVQEELLEAVRVPQLVLSSKDEPGEWKPGGKAEGFLKKNSTGHIFKEFPSMSHGFVPRGNLDDPTTKMEVARAMEYIKGFLCKHTPLGAKCGRRSVAMAKPNLVEREIQNSKPLTQLCCGCSLRFGVGLILLAYLARSIYVLVVTAGEVVVQDPRFESSKTLEVQTFNAFVALLGVPFILSGFYSLFARCDSYLRPFLYFMIASFLVDALSMVVPIWIHGACAFVPAGLKETGAAGACGFLRLLFLVFFGQLAAVEAYFIFAVWSLCEDMKVNLKSPLPEMYKNHRANRSLDCVGPAEALFGGQNHGSYGAF
eukprot:symbB.v1.2.019995.t1/scaffold1657.1/size107422/4